VLDGIWPAFKLTSARSRTSQRKRALDGTDSNESLWVESNAKGQRKPDPTRSIGTRGVRLLPMIFRAPFV